jgi:hypothetical protein
MTAVTRFLRHCPFGVGGVPLVAVGDEVTPRTIIFNHSPDDLNYAVRFDKNEGKSLEILKAEGDAVWKGEAVAHEIRWFGLGITEYISPVDGVIAAASREGGRILIRANPVAVPCLLRGRVAEIHPRRGIAVEGTGTVVKVALGVGAPACGLLWNAPERARPADLPPAAPGLIMVVPGFLGSDLLAAAFARRAVGIIADRADHVTLAGFFREIAGLTLDEFEARYYLPDQVTDRALIGRHGALDKGVPSDTVFFTVMLTGGFGEPSSDAGSDAPDPCRGILREAEGREAYLSGRVGRYAAGRGPEIIIF